MFEFIARADGHYWKAVRDAVSAWFARYPAEHQAELRTRLFSDEHWQGAYFELLLHELYRAAGHVVEVHPKLEGVDARPDFRIIDGQAAFLLEARVVTAVSAERQRRNRRLATLLETINRSDPGNFYLKLDLLDEGSDQPAAGPVVAELDVWLAQLDPGSVDRAVSRHGFDALPSRDVVTGGWTLRFTALPVDPEKRGKLSGPRIGLGPMEMLRSDPTAAMRKALSKKGRRYGATQLPLVVALALEEFGVETGDIAAALFGTVTIALSEEGELVGQRRLDDGYWSGRRSAGTRVGAVLTLRMPRPWNVTEVQPHLWLNPWAAMPFSGTRLWEWTTVDALDGRFSEGPSNMTTAELLRLPDGWPPVAAA